MPKLDLVYNAHSGAFREERLRALVQAFENHGFAVEALETRADGVQLSGRAELICVHGGDGTLRDTMAAMVASGVDAPLCIARSGTINLVARELHYPTDPEELAAKIALGWSNGPAGWVDSPLFLVDGLPIASCLSLGPDSHAVVRVSAALKRRIGRFAYVAALLKLLASWPRQSIQLNGELANGEAFTCKAEAVFVSRASFYAGPFRLSSKAALETNTVELVTLSRATRLRVLAFSFAAMLRLPTDRFGFAEIRSVRRVSGDCGAAPIQVDGDHIPDCELSIEPGVRTIRYVV